MRRGYLSQYFEGVGVKRLSAVEINPGASNQHEIQGARMLRALFGTERQKIPATFVWLGAENEGAAVQGAVTWYNAREKKPRSPEYKLYYDASSNPVMELGRAGDLLIVARRPGGEVLVVVARARSAIEGQLLWLFEVAEDVGFKFEYRDIEAGNDRALDFATRFVLEELGLSIEDPEANHLDDILEKFGNRFPSTSDFSAFARSSLGPVSARDDPDSALIRWLEREEKLFRRLERRSISDRLRLGFNAGDEVDIDGFMRFSLSVQNRRKSRVGRALEHHVAAVLEVFEISFDRGAETENRNTPDFLFPGVKAYHDPAFSADRLSMLAVKSTCKDRWRQVLVEAARIPEKHLLTLEPGISVSQTSDMRSKRLRLVVPAELQATYVPGQREWLMSVRGFIDLVLQRQLRT